MAERILRSNVSSVGQRDTQGPFPTLDVAMKSHIEGALVRTHGRIEGPYGAARLLRVNPHTLRARMRKLGVEWRRFRTNQQMPGTSGDR